jgi:hypothetical protein
MKNDKIRERLFEVVHNTSEYWAGIKVKEVTEGDTRLLDISPKELEVLQTLTETRLGRYALEKILFNHGVSMGFSFFIYVDGCLVSDGKVVELVNAETKEPICENMLHEYYSSYEHKS